MLKRIAPISVVALTFTFAACGVADESTGSEIQVEELAEVDGKADGASAARFETFTGRDGKTYFHLLAANGQKVLHSQGYASERNAQRGIDSVRANAEQPESFELLQAVDGQWYFNLVAGNGKIIGTSELYVTRANAERAIETVSGLVRSVNVARALASARFQVFKGLDGQYYFHLRANNGEIVLVSEGYTRKSSATAGTASVVTHGRNAARYEVRDTADGQAYFVLTATNGQVIAVSETYTSRSNAKAGAQAVANLLNAAALQ